MAFLHHPNHPAFAAALDALAHAQDDFMLSDAALDALADAHASLLALTCDCPACMATGDAAAGSAHAQYQADYTAA